MNDNPFAVLTAIVAPAILTNACSVLALGTSNRVGRVVDRARVLVAELATVESGTPPHQSRLVQLERLRTRSRLLLTALRTIYAALGGFASCALISVIGAVSAFYEYRVLFRLAATIALGVGLAAVTGLVAGCGVMVAETRLALRGVAETIDEDRVRGRAI